MSTHFRSVLQFRTAGFRFCRRMSHVERGRTLFEDQGHVDTRTIALTMGGPGDKDMERATDIMRSAANKLLADKSMAPVIMQYGPRQGSPAFRDELAKLLTHGYGLPVKSENLFVTPGATSGLHLVGSVFFPGSGTSAFVEDPTYFIAMHMLDKEMNMRVIAVKTQADGTDLADLEARVSEERAKHEGWAPTEKQPFWAMLYLVPTFNNPRGCSNSPDNCRGLVALARKYDLLLMCDDVYNLLSYKAGQPSPPRLLSYDDPADPAYKGGHVISNGSFSKVLGPGLRVGWIEAAPRIVHNLVFSNIPWSAGSLNHFTTEVLAVAMETGDHQKHIDFLSQQLGERARALGQLLKDKLPDGAKFVQPEGGYFMWLELPQHVDAAKVAADALKMHNVRVLPGAACSPNKKFGNCIRISVSYYPEDVLVEAVRKLCDVINSHV